MENKTYDGYEHKDGRKCILLDDGWFVPLDIGGEGYYCKRDHGEVAMLRRLAGDPDLLYTVPRRAIEDELIELRDAGIMQPQRTNGLVVRWADGSLSNIIRMGPESAIQRGLIALADHFEKESKS